MVRGFVGRLVRRGAPSRRLGLAVHRSPSPSGRSPSVSSVGRSGSLSGRVLWPSQVRSQRFRLVGFGRRGVDPEEVAAFLDRVAGDLAWAYGEVASLREQNARIKDALRSWQSRQAAAARDLAGYR